MATPARIDLSIIIPAYQEAAVIGHSLDTLAKFLEKRDYGTVEVLVVVPDSSDGTAALATAKAHLFEHFRVIPAGNRVGKGRDTRIGMFEARGRYRLFMDADLATPLDHLDDVKKLMDNNAEIGIAVRNLWVIHKGLLRKVISKSSNIAAQLLVTPGVKDTQCGFKVFRADVAEELFGRQTMLSWSFDAEILAIAHSLHYTIDYIDTPDWKDPKPISAGLVGDSAAVAAINGLLDLFKIRIALMKGKYHAKTFVYKPSTR